MESHKATERNMKHGKLLVELCKSVKSFCAHRITSPRGAQPGGGEMTWEVDRSTRLPGHDEFGTIVMKFSFPPGQQEVCRLVSALSLVFTIVAFSTL